MRKLSNRWTAIGLTGLIAVCLIGYSALTQPADPFQAAAVKVRPFPSLTYSVQTFLWWDDGYTGLTLDHVQMMGFSHIKQNFAWRDLEPAPGQWDFSNVERFMAEAQRRNIRVIGRLGQVPDWAAGIAQASSYRTDTPPASLADWASYCATVAETLRGRIVAYQIWNEPNLRREWGDREPNAAEYVAVLAACSEAIRAIDPDVILISAGLAPTGNQDAIAHRDDIYLDAMYRAGFQQYIDVVGVHAPGFGPPVYGPDDAERDGRGRWASFRRIEDLRKIMIQHGDAERQLAILEFGWTTDPVNPDYAWFAVSEEDQARNIVAAYEYAIENWRPWVGLMSLIYMPGSDWTPENEEWWWAIIEPPRRNRPAFLALVHMPKTCDEVIVPGLPVGLSEEEYRDAIRACP